MIFWIGVTPLTILFLKDTKLHPAVKAFFYALPWNAWVSLVWGGDFWFTFLFLFVPLCIITLFVGWSLTIPAWIVENTKARLERRSKKFPTSDQTASDY